MSIEEQLAAQGVTDIYAEWLELKRLEKLHQDSRRALEDKMLADFKVSDQLEGVQNETPDGYKVKITGRMTRKVDSDKVQELAAEAGLTEHLSTLFRWKPEINMAAWKNTDPSITNALLPGIETKPGRPSFTIEKE